MGFEESLGDPSDPNTPESDLRVLATSLNPEVRFHVAHNRSTPGEVLTMLATQDNVELEDESDWEPYNYEGDTFLDDWAEDPSLHAVVARNPSTPEDTLLKLYTSGREAYAVVRNPLLPESVVRAVWDAGDDDEIQNVLWLSNSLSDAFMIDVASWPDRWLTSDSTKSMLASRQDCPRYILEMLLRQSSGEHDVKVREAVARNTNLSPHLIAELAQHEEIAVRVGVAQNGNCPAEILLELAQDDTARVRLSVAENPSVGADALATLVSDSSEDVRRAVAKNPATRSEVRARL